jgi:hypothetical protein
MSNIKVYETLIDITENVGVGESGIYETKFTDSKELLKSLKETHGDLLCEIKIGCANCLKENKGDIRSVPCGWVFQRAATYEDCDESYTEEVWVVLIKQCELCNNDFVLERMNFHG